MGEDMVERWRLVGEQLRRARTDCQITLSDMSVASGYSVTHLSQVENGRVNPTSKIVQQYAERFRLDADGLNLLLGRLSPDMASYLAESPETLQRLRDEMERGGEK